MTILVWLLIGGAVVLIISGYENVSIVDTIKAVFQNKKLPTAPTNSPGFGDVLGAIGNDIFGNATTSSGRGLGGGGRPGTPANPNVFIVPSTSGSGSTQLAGPGTYVAGAGLTLNEVNSRVQGFVSACVETAGAILQGLWTGTQVTAQTVTNAANTLVSEGKADPQHGTNFTNEQGYLAGLGFQTTVVDTTGYTANQLASTISQYIQSGIPAGIGFSNAHVLKDTLSGRYWDVGVYGHAATIEGMDATGAFIADPNTPEGTPLVHYTWQNLADAQADSLLVPQTSGVLQ